MGDIVEIFLTSKSTEEKVSKIKPITFEPDNGIESNVVNIYEDVEFQKIAGFGAALTESAAVTYYKMSSDKRKEILQAYLDTQKGNGYTFFRTHINSCDFSEGNYACDEVAGDIELKHFNLEREKKALIPFIKEVQQACGQGFRLFASPWSPPPWMKTNGKMNGGGKLKPEYASVWADYYCKFIKAFEAEGISIWGVTVQNEPKAVQAWDSCEYTALEEKEFVKNYLAPALKAAQLGHIKIMIWDHNRERLYDRVKVAYEDEEASKDIWGSAFHWYSGDHFEALDLVKHRWPEKELVFSEGCFEQGPKVGSWDSGERYGHDILGCLTHGTTAWTDWNIILDEKGGPNHVGNYCDAPIIADTKKDELVYESSYYYIAHFSRFITPGSIRIGHTSYTSLLETAAFKTPEGEKVAVIINRNSSDIPVNLRYQDKIASFEMPANSIATFVF